MFGLDYNLNWSCILADNWVENQRNCGDTNMMDNLCCLGTLRKDHKGMAHKDSQAVKAAQVLKFTINIMLDI